MPNKTRCAASVGEEKKGESKVTNARGGESNHNFALAWDIGIFNNGAYLGESPLYDAAAQIVLAAGIAGLEWGGNWKTFQDRPHYQIKSPHTTKQIRPLFESGHVYI